MISSHVKKRVAMLSNPSKPMTLLTKPFHKTKSDQTQCTVSLLHTFQVKNCLKRGPSSWLCQIMKQTGRQNSNEICRHPRANRSWRPPWHIACV
jgi:hypothetical protein